MLLNKFDHDIQQRLKELQQYLEENPKAKYKSYIFRVEPEVIDYLDHIKKLTGIAVSQMVREAIQLYLKQLGNKFDNK
jgi:hypothetical protein